MPYDYESIRKAVDEAEHKSGYYTDFNDVDRSKLHEISDLLVMIRSKARGSALREVVAQLFERSWFEGMKKGNANLEVAKARGSYTELGKRLDDIVDSIQNINSGSPKAVFANNSELQATYPNGENGIFVTQDDGNWWYYNKQQSRWISGGNYQAAKTIDETGATVNFRRISNEFINEQGRVVKVDGVSSTDYIDLSGFDGYIYTYIATANIPHLATFFDENQHFIDYRGSSVAGEWKIPIFKNAKYVKISYLTKDDAKFYVRKTPKPAIEQILEELNFLKKLLNINVDYELIRGEFTDVRGIIHKSNLVNSTDYIDLSSFGEFVYTVAGKDSDHIATFFDENKQLLEASTTTQKGEWKIQIPKKARYIKIAFYDEFTNDFYVKKSENDEVNDLFKNPIHKTLKGRKLGIIGDSISTFEGYIPNGYARFYPHNDLDTVEKTWWHQLISNTGMELCANASWSGSVVSGDTRSTNGYVGASDARINALVGKNGEVPDIIITFIGINDFAFTNDRRTGEYNGKTAPVSDGNVTSITDAYGLMLKKLRIKYPKAQIFTCRIMPTRHPEHRKSFENGFHNINPTDNTSISEFNEKLEQISKAFGCPVIPMDAAGITYFNVFDYAKDGIHPDAEYAKKMARLAQKTLEHYVQ